MKHVAKKYDPTECQSPNTWKKGNPKKLVISNTEEEDDECYSPVLKHSEMSPTLSPKKGGGNEQKKSFQLIQVETEVGALSLDEPKKKSSSPSRKK